MDQNWHKSDVRHKLSAVIIDGNTISIANKSKTIDFRLAIRQVCDNGLITSPIPIRNGSNDNVFVALFDDTDTDFGFDVNNRSDTKNVKLFITYGKMYSLIVRQSIQNVVKVLEDCGRYLRFLTPNRPIGQSLADLYPSGDVNNNCEIRVICSRMKFALQVDTNHDSAVVTTPEEVEDVKSSPERQVFIKEEDEKKVLTKEEKKEFIKSEAKVNIKDETKVDIKEEKKVLIKECKEEDNEKVSKEENKVFNVSSVGQEVGKRGAIGFGVKSNQTFNKYHGFIADEDYYMEPFFIEFRLKNN
ncbi:unnamed protein product [Medioppia subpectinata]|uniref:Uncharacterized protein n=1 Tax=Medioppia subpectinata TaxID=1979941 RepID=A0A7R9KFG9_9ACAR|nr:unnamed protein product [Medioppia subpectinata]CAG2101614.1 unnamed protein product [Medioppia subpectinata]